MLLKWPLKMPSPINFSEGGGKEIISCHFIAATNDNTLCKKNNSATVDWGAKACGGVLIGHDPNGDKGKRWA